MSRKYKTLELDKAYFITVTTVGWVDVFTRLNQKYVILDALRYCQKNKGLEIYACVLMHSHLHMFCRSNGKLTIAEIMRDFKKFTSKKIIETINEELESRREWLLGYFEQSCVYLKRNQQYKVWQDGYHAEEIYSNKFIRQKINYIHQNPVEEKIVVKAEDYYFSSARNYNGLENELDIVEVFI
ncbi:transposase [Myroides odoratimimus]|uniref:REP-associated tyrosine transposase n=1 Tax=Myroides odoratimimus TaxID=76832 RepID=UPI0025775A88|nr:transposase [Myroides odoratimimus]MDM1064645.1 transposase [Myroides odoratimimus]MDM1092368.1 transposase [Myroides odoratimimus]MDM1325616.1 transposase [Myroides odoratimimus]MDM1443573.1 transposase [Myroides odoratimimus]MDM1446067.1 transposase [Myroides odoratimimus]